MSQLNADGLDEGIGVSDAKQPFPNEKPSLQTDVDEKAEDGIESIPCDSKGKIIVTGADVSAHLMPLRDDFDKPLTFRSLFLGSALVCFSSSMTAIYTFKPASSSISSGFLLLIAWFVGNAWAKYLPNGQKLEDRWRVRGGQGSRPWWISALKFLNPGPFTLKEHAAIMICAGACGDNNDPILAFAAQKLFFDLPLSAVTIILGTLSMGLFGYGLTGLMRPVCVWHPEAVYWSNLSTIKTIQGLHWEKLGESRPVRWFWYAFGGMAIYELIPAYMFTWLNGVSIPCLASQKTKGHKASVLTHLFGGSVSNEGLGLFSLCFDWALIGTPMCFLPLKLQLHFGVGLGLGSLVMLAIYYGNAWGGLSLPFMSTQLHLSDGTPYPLKEIFPKGILDKSLLEKYGAPILSSTFAYGLLMANGAIGALITHFFLFWGKDVWQTYKSAYSGQHKDPHHLHMVAHYKETPWWWHASAMGLSFIFGIIVVCKEDITVPPWTFVVTLFFGIVISPISGVLFSRFGNGIATNNLFKMIAGLMIPGRPMGNMYVALWSHNVVANSIELCQSLKMGIFFKVSSRVVFCLQIWGSMLGAFINYALMTSIVKSHREILVSPNGNTFWTGVSVQSYSTNASSWALSSYMYKIGSRYQMVPVGLAIGSAAVLIHRLIYQFFPKIRGFSLLDINLAQFIYYAGCIATDLQRTGPIFTLIFAGLLCQLYLRNYHPHFYKDYMWIVGAGLDAGSGLTMFILTFAVFGVGGPEKPFPQWWGNNQAGYTDWCPAPEST